MATANTTTLSDAIKTQYEKRLLTSAKVRLIHGNWATKATISNFGTYELRRYSVMSAITTALSEGVTPSEAQAPTPTLTTLTPSWYGAWLGYTDKLDMTVYDPVVSMYVKSLGYQAGLSADTLYRNDLVANATIDYSNGKSAIGSLDYPGDEISFADLVYQIAALDADNAMPIEGQDYILIIHPHTAASLMQDPTFVNLFVQEAPDTTIRSGYIGRLPLMRCRIYISSNAYEQADSGFGSTTDVYSNLIIGAESYGALGIGGLLPSDVDTGGQDVMNLTGKEVSPVEVIMKPLGAGDDPLNQRGTLAWKMTLDTEVLNSSWIRNLKSVNVFSDD